jgi:hypothetical protein
LHVLAAIIGFDPRLLVGRPVDAPWTDRERSTTISALRQWWRQNGARPLQEIVLERIGDLPPEDMANLLQAARPGFRSALLDRIAAAWKAVSPAIHSSDDLDSFAAILRFADRHAGFATVVQAWPTQGPLLPLMACWRERHGDASMLDAMLEQSLALPSKRDLEYDFRMALSCPSPSRLARLQMIAAGAVDDPRFWILLESLSERNAFPGEGRPALIYLNGAPGARIVGSNQPPQWDDMHAAVALTLLIDVRVLPASMIHVPGRGGSLISFANGPRHGVWSLDKRDPPIGMRVRDAALLILANVDPWLSQTERDAQADELIRTWAEPARRAWNAAGTPDLLPQINGSSVSY